jgi:hypothetical protein
VLISVWRAYGYEFYGLDLSFTGRISVLSLTNNNWRYIVSATPLEGKVAVTVREIFKHYSGFW